MAGTQSRSLLVELMVSSCVSSSHRACRRESLDPSVSQADAMSSRARCYQAVAIRRREEYLRHMLYSTEKADQQRQQHFATISSSTRLPEYSKSLYPLSNWRHRGDLESHFTQTVEAPLQ